MTDPEPKKSLDTLSVHAGEFESSWANSLLPSIAQTSTYVFDSTEQLIRYRNGDTEHAEYGRYANPTTAVAEAKLAQLEQAESALLCSSGMAAVSLTLLTILGQNQHVIITEDHYPGVRVLLETLVARFGCTFSVVPVNDQAAIEAAIESKTSLLFTEYPTNPHLYLPDLEMLAGIAKKNRLTLVVDATLATPLMIRPLLHGADLVIHSATKYLGGHNDLLAGAICGKQAMIDAIRETNAVIGAVADPHTAYLLNRGLKTLPVRFRVQSENAWIIAERLGKRSDIEAVFYPQLTGSSGQQAPPASGGLLSFRPTGGFSRSCNILDSFRLFRHAASLGGVESMAQITYLYTAQNVSAIATDDHGIESDLIRLSVGIEAIEDLWNDIEQALERSK